ncbi:hypothetical protein J2X20_001326 [Pelomonas saccharophila]|uniref:DUF3563 domain-containing protein n=1 Tax=Roseateles saccharophilus TaxID=304 RepID=A0ABU1YIL6_ROSSA|nr:DUF3563 family protein [Roseateles saccharophilus]MDR7268697.1 hypothetical protein [Roseateles saccharophilus]
MHATATWTSRSAVTGLALRLRTWLPGLLGRFMRDDDEAFLCEARDLADLERRLRRLEQGRSERFRALPGLP